MIWTRRGEKRAGGGNKGTEEKTKKVREWIVELALKQSVSIAGKYHCSRS